MQADNKARIYIKLLNVKTVLYDNYIYKLTFFHLFKYIYPIISVNFFGMKIAWQFHIYIALYYTDILQLSKINYSVNKT